MSGTFQDVHAGSGNVTGYYYILMDKVPPGLGSYEMRAFVQDIVHRDAQPFVELYPDTRMGWIKIFGFHNFEIVVKHLRTTQFLGRYIDINTSNKTNSVLVKQRKRGWLLPTEPSSSEPQDPRGKHANYDQSCATASGNPGYYGTAAGGESAQQGAYMGTSTGQPRGGQSLPKAPEGGRAPSPVNPEVPIVVDGSSKKFAKASSKEKGTQLVDRTRKP